MKHSEIVIGQTYVVKVSGKLAPVRVEKECTTVAWGTRAGGNRTIRKFMGRNLRTDRIIGPFTAAKCRYELYHDGERWVRVKVGDDMGR